MKKRILITILVLAALILAGCGVKHDPPALVIEVAIPVMASIR